MGSESWNEFWESRHIARSEVIDFGNFLGADQEDIGVQLWELMGKK